MKKILVDTFVWGFILWLIGYILGIVLFPFFPTHLIGWIIMPIGTLITLWILLKKIKSNSFHHYVRIAIVWTVIAIICDYFFLLKLFKPSDGYYKLDVYLYYILVFVLPLFIGWYKSRKILS